MPWISIITFLVSFLLQAPKTSSDKAKAAMVSAGAALGAYALFDPSNPNNYFGVGTGATPTAVGPGDTTASDSSAAATAPASAAWANTATASMNDLTKAITNPNTAMVIGAAGAATGSGIFGSSTFWLLALGAVVLLNS
jgi:hypothetical protein